VSYNYETEVKLLLTRTNVKTLFRVWSVARGLLSHSGACTFSAVFNKARGDSFEVLAAVDLLIEMKYLTKVWDDGSSDGCVFTLGDEAP
jgi:hypothetical protein